MPPPDPPTDSQEQYRQYQYGAEHDAVPHADVSWGHCCQFVAHVVGCHYVYFPCALQPPAVYDSLSVNDADHYTNFNGDHDHDIPNFGDSSIPKETRDELHGHHSAQEYYPSSGTNLVTVYKKAPGAPKRFRSSYVHFFKDFLQKKKQELGPDGLVSFGVVFWGYYVYIMMCAQYSHGFFPVVGIEAIKIEHILGVKGMFPGMESSPDRSEKVF